ncbi:MAG TPA: histidine phosphotransferase family protein [Dongiaceae bacterium]
MSEMASLRVASLLASRLCHDLIGPLGAVDNGLELIAEEGRMAEEALALAQRSTKRAAARLRYFRYAFGAAGEDASFGTSEARGLAQNLLHTGEIQLTWSGSGAEILPPGACRLLLNMILLGVDCLPRGGVIHILALPDRLSVDCTAPQARVTPELKAAMLLTAPLGELTARTVVGYYAALLAVELGGHLDIPQESPDRIRLESALGSPPQP